MSSNSYSAFLLSSVGLKIIDRRSSKRDTIAREWRQHAYPICAHERRFSERRTITGTRPRVLISQYVPLARIHYNASGCTARTIVARSCRQREKETGEGREGRVVRHCSMGITIRQHVPGTLPPGVLSPRILTFARFSGSVVRVPTSGTLTRTRSGQTFRKGCRRGKKGRRRRRTTEVRGA